MRVQLPILYSQLDTRWAKLLLGFNTNAEFNFYNYACLISCHAMVARYFGKDETPITINDKLKGLGAGKGFSAGGGNYVWGALPKLFTDIGEKKTETPNELTDAQMNEIKDALDNGFPVVFQIDVNPKTVANDTHYVTVVDYNAQDENDFTIADPIGGQLVSLKKYLGFLRPSARKSIYKYIIYTGPKPKLDAGTIPVPKDVWPNVVHGSTEWDKTVAEYKPGNDPKSTSFEDVQAVVGGYKSRATTMENERNDAQKALAVAQKEVQNRIDQIANLTKDCQMQIDAKNAELSALKENGPAQAKLIESLQGQIEQLRGDLRVAQIDGGKKDLEITQLGNDLEVCKTKNPLPVPAPSIDSLTVQELVAKLFEKLFSKSKQ